MKNLLLEHMRWPEIREAIDNGMDTVILYAASIEQHGPHLPENTDVVLGYAGAEDLARRLGNALVAPVIRPGLSLHHMALPGTVTLRPEVFEGLVKDHVAAYVQHGFKRIVLSSSHGGNFETMSRLAASEGAHYRDQGITIVSGISLNDMLELLAELEVREGLAPGTLGGHSDAWETSEMLMLGNENVRQDLAEQGYMGGLLGGDADRMFHGGVVALSPNGIVGDARPSDPQRGARIFQAMQDAQEKAVRENFARAGASL